MAKRKSKDGELFDGDGGGSNLGTATGGEELEDVSLPRRRGRGTSITRSPSSPRAPCRTCATASSRCSAASSTRCGSTTSTADAKHRKCATVVGEVMGNYHPHGDQSIYDALVRMAQPFVLRARWSTVRATSARSTATRRRHAVHRVPADAASRETAAASSTRTTVTFRPNYDGTRSEPVVLPAQFPNLLVNGTTGIAVGMATNIPPHNLGEVCDGAASRCSTNPDLTAAQLVPLRSRGPTSRPAARSSNARASSARSTRRAGRDQAPRHVGSEAPTSNGRRSISSRRSPTGSNKATLVERIGELIGKGKVPQLVDVQGPQHRRRPDRARAEAGRRRQGDGVPVQEHAAADQLQRQPDLPAAGRGRRGRPSRAARTCKAILWHFLDFRLDVVTRRLQHELAGSRQRIHILEGFAIVFDNLDEAIKIIRASDGKADAAAQADEARSGSTTSRPTRSSSRKLYRLGKLEILNIREELEEKRQPAREITTLLEDEPSRWDIVKVELEEIQKTYGDARRTMIVSDEGEVEYTAEDFIVAEDNHVLVTRDGWVKRQKEMNDLETTRLREGDASSRWSPAARARRSSSSATTAPRTPPASSTSPRPPVTASRSRSSSS